jgi:AN1-type zinc finger protein 5/6
MMNDNDNIKLEVKDSDSHEKSDENQKKEVNKEVNKESTIKINIDSKKRAHLEDIKEESPKKKQINTSRCLTCNRKIGLLGFQCKCKNYFCSEHRYSDRHDCTFDYKEHGKDLLKKANPVVISSKLDFL